MSMGFGFRKTSAWSDSTTCLAWITCTHREGLGVAAMRETLRLLGEGGEPTFLTTQHGMGLIPAEVRARRSLGPAPRR